MSLRILHIGKYFPPVAGGIENFLGDLLPSLEKNGVSVAALVHDDVRKRHEGIFDATMPIFRVPSYGTLLYAPLSPAFPFALNKAIREFRPDLLHFHLPNTSAFWALILPVAGTVPWIVHWHSDVVPSMIDRRMAPAYRLYQPVEKRFLSRARSIIVTSQPYLNSSNTLSEYKDKCRVVPLGLNPERLKMPGDADLRWADAVWGQRDRRVLIIGRLTYYKGHDVILDAAQDLKGIRILIVGDGECKAGLKRRIHDLGISYTVSLQGSLPESALHALLSTCDCLCLPSVERTEAFGLVLLEAMRYGKPVVASNIPGSGIGWVVEDGVTGFWVPPGDPLALTRTLNDFFDQPELKRKMGHAAMNRFQKVFQIDHVAQQIILIYHQLLKA